MPMIADSIECFREFARLYSRARRAFDNAGATERSMERRENALAMQQALEAEHARCFRQIAQPDWDAVQRAAAGEIAG